MRIYRHPAAAAGPTAFLEECTESQCAQTIHPGMHKEQHAGQKQKGERKVLNPPSRGSEVPRCGPLHPATWDKVPTAFTPSSEQQQVL